MTQSLLFIMFSGVLQENFRGIMGENRRRVKSQPEGGSKTKFEPAGRKAYSLPDLIRMEPWNSISNESQKSTNSLPSPMGPEKASEWFGTPSIVPELGYRTIFRVFLGGWAGASPRRSPRAWSHAGSSVGLFCQEGHEFFILELFFRTFTMDLLRISSIASSPRPKTVFVVSS